MLISDAMVMYSAAAPPPPVPQAAATGIAVHCNPRWGGLLASAFSHAHSEAADMTETLLSRWRGAVLDPPSEASAAHLSRMSQSYNMNVCTIPYDTPSSPGAASAGTDAEVPAANPGAAAEMLRAATFPGRSVAYRPELAPWLTIKGSRSVGVTSAPLMRAAPPPAALPQREAARKLRRGDAWLRLLSVDLGPEWPLRKHATF